MFPPFEIDEKPFQSRTYHRLVAYEIAAAVLLDERERWGSLIDHMATRGEVYSTADVAAVQAEIKKMILKLWLAAPKKIAENKYLVECIDRMMQEGRDDGTTAETTV